MTLRVGRIPFLVCAPFFFNSVGRENEFPEVAFVDGPPSAHSAGLKDGSIHLSPASSITFAQKPGGLCLVAFALYVMLFRGAVGQAFFALSDQ